MVCTIIANFSKLFLYVPASFAGNYSGTFKMPKLFEQFWCFLELFVGNNSGMYQNCKLL